MVLCTGCIVDIEDEEDSIIPAGRYAISRINEDGSFMVGGNTAVWPRRISKIISIP